MQKITIYKIGKNLYIKYTPSHTTQPESVPNEVINYKGTLYTPVDVNNLPFPPQLQTNEEVPW
jgi:hypothetical protein